jgi:hypothetical protein
MATLSEVIGGCKTSPNRAIRWTPCGCGGKLEIHCSRAVTTYTVREFKTNWLGRAFRVTKGNGEAYNVFAANDRRYSTCDCAGFAYGRGKPCRHLEAVYALLSNRWLDELMSEVPADPPYTDAEREQMAKMLGGE